MADPLHITRALLHGEPRDFYTTTHIEADLPADAVTLDFNGYAIWPALINAHDHLELNHYPRSKFRQWYDNAHQWGEDINSRLSHPPYRQGQSFLLADRLFIGGLKNLLCGALTVVHHNPLHKLLERPDFPVSVLRRYGWAHSLDFEKDVVETYLKVERDVPWIIHLAEGIDQRMALEFGRLKKLGCAQPNVVLVHGVGLTEDDMLNGARNVRGLIWCPSSNRYLLGFTANVQMWKDLGGRVALGNDSRLTADGDLLDEIRAALDTDQVDAEAILSMATTEPAAIFDLGDVGSLEPGKRADWIATRADQPLTSASRADLALVVRGGIPLIGDPEVMARFPNIATAAATLDGRPKAIHADLVRRVLDCELAEPGLEVEGWRRRHTGLRRLRSRLRFWEGR